MHEVIETVFCCCYERCHTTTITADTTSKPANQTRTALRRLLAICIALVVGYVCIRTLRFTYAPLNSVFAIIFFLIRFLTIRPIRRLRRGPKIDGAIVLTPLLVLSLLLLIVLPVAGSGFGLHPELIRDLGTVQLPHSSIHRINDGTYGALGPHGLSLQQRVPILPGLYAVKYLDWFEGAYQGSLSSEGPAKVRVTILKRFTNSPPTENVYTLKAFACL